MVMRSIVMVAVLVMAFGCKNATRVDEVIAEAVEAASVGTPTGDAGARTTGAATDAAPGEQAPDDQAADDQAAAAPASDDSPVTEDILARDPVTDRAEVRHVLVSWDELATIYAGRGGQDPRGAARTRPQANALAASILERVRGGEDIRTIMSEISEDRGSALTGAAYTATPDAGLVEPFKNLSLRLNAGEAGVVETIFGYHIIQRDAD